MVSVNRKVAFFEKIVLFEQFPGKLVENTFDNCEISSKLEIFELEKVPAIIHKFQQQKQVGSQLRSNQ